MYFVGRKVTETFEKVLQILRKSKRKFVVLYRLVFPGSKLNYNTNYAQCCSRNKGKTFWPLSTLETDKTTDTFPQPE